MIKLIGGGILIAFGSVIFFGVLLSLTDRTSEYSLTADLVGAFIFGVVPISMGGLLIRSHYKKKRQALLAKEKTLQEKRERAVLSLAYQKGGRLTIVDIARETSMSTTEAEEMMKDLTIKGHVNIQVTDSGGIVYEFPGIGHRNKLEE